ncbi:MAG: glycoside hydrolase family 31 protein [Tunicatimonas sp.]
MKTLCLLIGCYGSFALAFAQPARELSDTLELPLLENERWWGGMVSHGMQMPFGTEHYAVDQWGDNNANQAQPLFVSNRGRYLWCDEPLAVTFDAGMLRAAAHRGKIVHGQSGTTLREAYLAASQRFFPPSGDIPDSLLFTRPQFNTWIELQYDQNEAAILSYAQSIVDRGFAPGVLMIDDTWQANYGTWQFAPERFTDPAGMMEKLHALGFKVMLWICPFVSADSPNYRKLSEQGVLMFEDSTHAWPAMVRWWNGVSAVLDLSHPEGRAWYTAQMQQLMNEYGVDGFKLDAGDAHFYQGLSGHQEGLLANDHSTLHAQVGLAFPMNEYRACWKMGGQALAQRLRDKLHRWEDLRSLIPDMLAQGLMGYPYGCPDMIGGGDVVSFENDEVLDEELIVRSTQVHALMPMMQFSVAPWRVLSAEHLAICQEMAQLHQRMGAEIMQLAQSSALTGEPIVRAMEYVFPEQDYEAIKDQFMVGDDILVAPVVQPESRSRVVHFPAGTWKGDDGKEYVGPTQVALDVPIERLPWFRRKE